MLKLSRNPDTNQKYTPEELSVISLEDVKKLITDQVPDAFTVKAKAKAKPKKAAAVKKK
jgi:DNA topoisomerase-1